MNEMSNDAQLTRVGGSPAGALSNNFTLNSNDILQEAWELTKSTKLPFLLGTIIIYAIAVAFSFVLEPFQPDQNKIEDLVRIPWLLVLGQIAVHFVLAVLIAGLISMGLRNAVRHVKTAEVEATIVPPNSATMVFSHFSTAWPIVAIELTKMLGLLVIILAASALATALSLSLTTIFGVVTLIALTFALGLSLAVPLVIKDQLGPLKAMRISLTVVFRRLFVFLSLYAVFFVLAILSLLTLGIGLIWTIPLFYNAKGIIYREVFGIETHAITKNEPLDI